jgi:SAM-dependent methyltransferase
MAATTTAGSATVQGRLWGVRADDWAAIQERQVAAAFTAGLDALGVTAGTRLLDAGCGAGMVLRLAADRGADVAGLDASEPLLVHARRRVPGATIVHGELEDLPFEDASFDAVTGFNSFQYAARPAVALAEAVRVLRPGGRVLLLTWGPPEQCEAAAYLAALRPLLPPPPPGAPGPFALSEPDALKTLFAEAGLSVAATADVPCAWWYDDEATAVDGLLASGPVVLAIENAGEDAVRAVVKEFLAPFRTPEGGYRIKNDFRYAIGTPEQRSMS